MVGLARASLPSPPSPPPPELESSGPCCGCWRVPAALIGGKLCQPTSGAGLVVAGAAGQPQPDVVGEGALAQLQHHPIGAGHLAEMGADAADGGRADEQRCWQLDQRWRGVEQSLGIVHQVVVADGDAAAQLVAVAVEAGAEGGGKAAKTVARISRAGPPSRRAAGWCGGRWRASTSRWCRGSCRGHGSSRDAARRCRRWS